MSHKNFFYKSLPALLGIAALGMSSMASANLLVNPSFESPSLGGAAEAPGGGDGWSPFGGAFTISDFTSAALLPHDGVQMAKVFGVAGFFQDFAVGAGDVVDATSWAFNDSADAMVGGQVAAVNIEWFDSVGVCTDDGGGGCVVSFGSTLTSSTPLDVWTNIGVLGAGTPATSTIARIVLITGDFAGPGGGAPKFDDASFVITPSAVPVPAAVWLFGSGLVGLVGIARRKKVA